MHTAAYTVACVGTKLKYDLPVGGTHTYAHTHTHSLPLMMHNRKVLVYINEQLTEYLNRIALLCDYGNAISTF